MRPFGEAQSKAMRTYVQSGQYHTIVDNCVRLTLYNYTNAYPICGMDRDECIFLKFYERKENI